MIQRLKGDDTIDQGTLVTGRRRDVHDSRSSVALSSAGGYPLVTVEQSRPDSAFHVRHAITAYAPTAPASLPATDRYIAAFDASPTPTLLTDAAERIVWCNAAMRGLLHTPSILVIGRPWRFLLEPRLQERDALTPTRARPDTDAYTLRDGAVEQPVRVRSIRLHGQAGDALLLVEPEMAEADTPALDGTLLLDAAHELRSPLLALSLALSGLDTTGAVSSDRADDERLIRSLQRSTIHLQTLVENLLDTARIGANLFTVDPKATMLRTIVREAVHVVTPLLRGDGQRIVVELPEDDLVVLADAQRICQVLVNLLHNAIKYGPTKETIMVRAGASQGCPTVEVVDGGAGIPVDERARLFTRCYRGTNTTAMPGSGLGLAICKAIVEAHGGDIGVRGGAGQGTVFWFTLRLV